MAARVQLTGGAFQDSEGNVLANGYLRMYLSQDASVAGVGNVCSGVYVQIALDSSGNVVTNPAQSVWGNDQLSPVNTYYRVYGYTAAAQVAWGPNNQQVTGSGGTFNLGTWVPNQVVSWSPSLQTVTFQTNGVNNGSQSKYNVVAGSGMTITDDGSGDITFVANPTTPTGSLSIGAVGAAPSTLNVSTEGTKDWFIPSPANAGQAIYLPYGWRWKGDSGTAGTSAEMVESFRLISVGSAVTYSSGNGSGTPSITATAGDEACDVNDTFTPPFGYPTTSQAPYRSLVSVNYPGNPFGWSFLTTSDSTSRTLNLYFDIGGNTSANNSITATVFAHLLDGSAANVSSSVTLGGGTGSASYKVSITFKSGTGSKLLVTNLITAASGTNPGCELRFRAATVQ